MARLRVVDPMGHAGGETEVLRRRRRPPVDGERAALGREGERHPAARADQPVVAFRLGGVVGDVDRIRAGLVAVVGDPQRMDTAPGSEDQRGLSGGLVVVRHPRPVRLRGDRDPPLDRRQRQRQGVGAPSLGIQRLRRGNVPGMPGIDDVPAGRDVDFDAWAFGHERAVEEPPDRGMAGLGGRPERGGALAQDDVDLPTGPGRPRDREGFGHEALRADAQGQRPRPGPYPGPDDDAPALGDLDGGGRRGLGRRDGDFEPADLSREMHECAAERDREEDGGADRRPDAQGPPTAPARLRECVLNCVHRRRSAPRREPRRPPLPPP